MNCYHLPVVVEALEKPRQPLPHLEAVYFMVPSEEVSTCVCVCVSVCMCVVSVLCVYYVHIYSFACMYDRTFNF